MTGPLIVAIDPDLPIMPAVVEGTAEFPVVLEATAEFAATLEATAEIPVALDAHDEEAWAREQSAMADPHGSHSPMSPDDQVSDKHTGLPMEQHSTGGTTPMS